MAAPDVISWRKPGGDDRCEGGPSSPGEFSGEREISGGVAPGITGVPGLEFTVGFFPKISLGNSTWETPKIATGFWSNTVWVTDAWTIPVLIDTEPFTLEMLSVNLPAPMSSVANVGWTGFTIDSREPNG